jgi:hypothetical protein
MPGGQFGTVLTQQGVNPVTTLTFDFDIFSIMFNYGGGGGNFNGIVYDIASSQLGSFIDPSMTNTSIPYPPVTLSSSTAIRSFSFFDSVGTGGSAIDNLILDTGSVSAVPVPAAVWLFGTALIGLVGFGKRRKAA